jgi:ankyrin repeat protein
MLRNCWANMVAKTKMNEINIDLGETIMLKTHPLLCRLSRFEHFCNASAAVIVLIALACTNGCAPSNYGARGSTEPPVVGGPIHEAARIGDLEKVRALIKENPDLIFSTDSKGDTPLHWASCNSHKEVIEFLLANKANINAVDSGGLTPLHCAVGGYDRKDVAELLLANRADINAKNSIGWTPLHFAAAKGYKDVVALLITHQADVNAKDNKGWTPLHDAAIAGYAEVAELLLANHADVNAVDNRGSTPLHEATTRGNRIVAEVLRNHGGHE